MGWEELNKVLGRREQQTQEMLNLLSDATKNTAIHRSLMHMHVDQVDVLLASIKETRKERG